MAIYVELRVSLKDIAEITVRHSVIHMNTRKVSGSASSVQLAGSIENIEGVDTEMRAIYPILSDLQVG